MNCRYVARRNITLDALIAAAQRIFQPWSIDVREVVWWSVYEIGQRMTDNFDDVPQEEAVTRLPRVFIAGDASNLGWKLASVLMRGTDRQRGCLLIIRPDQYVTHVLPLGAHDELADFFARFMLAVP